MNTILNKRTLASGISAIAVAAAMTVATPALAQSSTSTLQGSAPPGSEVIATQVDTGVVRRATVRADGTYTMPGLPSGSYRVTDGSVSQDVVVPVASVQVVDFAATAPVAAEKGAIVVTSTRPTAETRSSQVNQFVTLHDIAALPQTTRNFLEFADTVPGVQFNVDASGNTSLRGGAQLASAVNVFIDGVSQKDYVSGGSGITGSAGNGRNGDPGNPFPQLAIAEYKVVTSNYSAQYGDASSAIIIAQTKSGTNRFQAEAFGTFTNQDLRSKTPAEVFFKTDKPKIPDWQYGAAVGGPIVPDVAHFFFTWEHKSLSNQSSVFPGNGITLAEAQSVLPPDIASQYGPVTNPFTENLYFGKVDIEPTQNDRIEFTGKLRIEHNFTGGNGQAAASTRAPYRNNDKRGDVRWQHTGNDWFNQLLVSYQTTDSSTATTSASPQSQYVFYPNPANNQFPVTLIQVGGPGSGVGAINRQKGWTVQEDFTYTGLHLWGDHTLHAGASYGAIDLNTQDVSSDPANATYYYAVTPNGVASTPYELQFPNLAAGYTTANVTTTARQYSAYVQDDWNVNRNLTLNLGVRWDHEVVPAYLNYVTPSDVVTALNGPYCVLTSHQPCTTNLTAAEVFAMGNGTMPGFDINDYISTGHNRKAPNNFSPRLGFSYDINGDNRHVIFGGYARAFNRNQFRQLALEITKIALNSNPEVYFPSLQTRDPFGDCFTAANINPANHCYAWDPAYLTPEGLAGFQTGPTSHEVDLLNNNLRTPHSDQFSLGMRNRIGDWNTQATLTYVESYDSLVGRFANRYQDGSFYQGGTQWAGSQGVPGIGTLILFDNTGHERLFQLGLGAQKPYTRQSGWSATFAYTFSAGGQNNLAGPNNPLDISNNEYIFDIPYPRDVPLKALTAVPLHRVVATYSRDLPLGFSMAAKLELATPTARYGIFPCPNGFPCGPYQGNVLYYSARPKDFLGYKDLDLQLTKDFSFFNALSAYFRVDVLNVFNWANYDSGAIEYPNAQTTPYYREGGPIAGVPRTVKFSAGVKFGDRPLPPPAVVESPPPPPPPATQTCPDGSVIDVAATCPVPPPPPPPPPPAPVEKGERGQ